MISKTLDHLRSSVRHRVWIFSDLQQSDPDKSRTCLTKAVQDFQQLGLDCDRIWYLGDAIEGIQPKLVREMAAMHVELLQPLGIPLRYVLGNHDFDIVRHKLNNHMADAGSEVISCYESVPFYDAIQSVPGWKTIPQLQSHYFTDSLGDFQIVFLSDHCSKTGDWVTTNGEVHGNQSAYIYQESDYKKLSKEIEASGKPTILTGHYAFSGGNRPSALLDPMLPLPSNVRIHFHGHAHIGDTVWAGKDCFRKISYTKNQPIPQINVSSLENQRGNRIRSVILEIYEDESMGVYFRDHDQCNWAEMYLIDKNR